MLEPSRKWFQQVPKWVWWSGLPYFGGLAITYAGYKSKTPQWCWLGLGITAATFASLVISNIALAQMIWVVQIGIAIYLKPAFLAKIYPRHFLLPDDPKTARLITKS